MALTVYLSVRQVAEHLGVSTDSIYRWKRNGESPAAVKLGPGFVRWRRADVEAWEQSRAMCFGVSFCGFDVAST